MQKFRQFISKRKWLIVLTAVIVGGGLFVYSRQQAAQPVVQTVTPETREIAQSLSVSGNVDAHEKANLKFAAASKLTWLPVKEGDAVKKWQTIAAVDSRQLQKQLEINQNLHGIQFRNTEGVFEANDVYSETGLTEPQRRQVESSQLSLRNTALTVEIQDIAIRNATMVSPIEGLVTQIDQPNVGANVFPTDIFQVVNPKTVYFSVIVDEADIGKVSLNQSAAIVFDAYPEETVNTVVEKVAFTPSTSQTGGQGYRVTLRLPADNNGLKYRLGMSGDAEIILNKKAGVLSIPTDAIVERDNTEYVDVLRNDKTERVEIQVGITDGDYAEVTGGLSPTDQVVVPTGGQ